MRDVAAGLAKDYVALALAGIGISFPAHHFIGGLFLAFAGAAVAAKWQPEQDRRELWLVMLGAFFAATVMAQAVQAWRGWYLAVGICSVAAMATAGMLDG